MRIWIRTALFCALALLIGATGWSANNTIKVGVFAQGGIGRWQRQGYALAFSQLKKEGIDIKPVYLGCPANVNWVMNKVEKLDNDGVVALLGGSNSKCTSYLAGVSQRRKIPLISPFSPMELLSRFGFQYVFRLNAPIRWYIDALLKYAVEQEPKPKTIAFVWEDTPFGRRFTVFAEDKAKELGLRVVANQGIDLADKGRKAAEAVVKAKPDVLMLVGNQVDSLRVLKWIKESCSPKVLLGAGAGFSMQSFVKTQGGAAEGLVTLSQWYPTVNWPGSRELVAAFKKRFKRQPNYVAAEAYAAVQVLGDALKKANCTATAQCREALRKALTETKTETVFGPVRFDSFNGYTNQNPHQLLLLKIEKGTLKIVSPPELATN